MDRKRSITQPLYVPDEFVAAYGEEAHRQVVRSARRAATTIAPPSRSATRAWRPSELRAVRLAVIAGVGTWAALVMLWFWFALQTGSWVWTAAAAVGAITLLLAAAALPRLSLFRTRLPAPAITGTPTSPGQT